MKPFKNIVLLLALVLFSCAEEKNLISFTSDHFQISIDQNGVVHELNDIQNKVNYLAKDTTAVLLSIRVASKIIPPTSVTFESSHLTFDYPRNITAWLKVEKKDSNSTFKAVEITVNDCVELALWFAVPTTTNKIIGKTTGVVGGHTYAIGILTLNPKILSAYPSNKGKAVGII